MNPILLGFGVATGVFIAIYAVWFIVSVIVTFYFFCRIPIRNRLLFLLNILFLAFIVGTVCAGVFSPFYWNGGIFMFFLALFNMYVYVLLYFNWPTQG